MDKVSKRLMDFNSLREYIQSSALIKTDGTVCADDKTYNSYFEGSLSEDWFLDYSKNPANSYFSSPHMVLGDRSAEYKIISYIKEIRDIENPLNTVGYLVLNIYSGHFEKIISLESEGFDSYVWFTDNHTVIYEQNLESFDLFTTDSADSNVHNTDIFKGKNGYVIKTEPMSNGWRLATFTLNSTLLERTNYILIIFILFIVISLTLIILIILPIVLGITRPITKLTKVMGKVRDGNMDVNLSIHTNDELQILGEGFNKMIEELKVYIAKSIDYEKTKRNMEFNLLLSQINPHFIYNTLNTVIYMAKKNNNEDIARMMDSFIRILQDAVKIGEQGVYATVGQEINIVRHYVNIQQYRYPQRFNVVIDADDDVIKASVPKMVMQPLIENSIIHGIFPSERIGEIKLTVKKDGEDLIINIYDNGSGIDNDTLLKLHHADVNIKNNAVMRSIGIPNIIERIKYLYGEKYGLMIESKYEEWTSVTVRIPFCTHSQIIPE